MITEYRLDKIEDLITVPIDRREDCVKEILAGLMLHELAFGEEAADTPFSVTWTDDDSRDVTLSAVDGQQILKLEITEAEALPDMEAGGKTPRS